MAKNDKYSNKPIKFPNSKPNNGSKRPYRNYFTMGTQQGGEDFINAKSDQELIRDCNKVLRDLATGKVNISQHVPQLLNPRLINALVTMTSQKTAEYSAIARAFGTHIYVTAQQGYQLNPYDVQLSQYYKDKATMYQISYNYFMSLQQSYDVNWYVSLVNEFAKANGLTNLLD